MSMPAELPVYRSAVTALFLPADPGEPAAGTPGDGSGIYLPAVTAWTSWDAVDAARLEMVDGGEPFPVLHLIAAERVQGTSQVRLTVADVPRDAFPTREEARAATLRLPVSLVTVWAALSLPGFGFRLLLCGDPVPAAPEEEVHALEGALVGVLSDPEVLHEALNGSVPQSWLTATEVDMMMRAGAEGGQGLVESLWLILAGVALGEQAAFHRLLAFAAVGEAAAGEGQEMFVSVVSEACEGLLTRTRAALAMTGRPGPFADGFPGNLPPEMAPLQDLLVAHVDPAQCDAFDGGTTLREAAEASGWAASVTALGVYVAWTGHALVRYTATAAGEPTTATPSLMLAHLMVPDAPPTLWAVRATAAHLVHHDSRVLADLLASSTVGAGDLLASYLHMLSAAVAQIAPTRESLVEQLAAAEIKPVNQADLTRLAEGLWEAAADLDNDPDDCPVCALMLGLHAEGWPVTRLVAAAAPMLPLLADLDAAAAHHQVGDEDWVEHRGEYVAGWLAHAEDASF